MRQRDGLGVLQIDDVLVEVGGQVEGAIAALMAGRGEQRAFADVP